MTCDFFFNKRWKCNCDGSIQNAKQLDTNVFMAKAEYPFQLQTISRMIVQCNDEYAVVEDRHLLPLDISVHDVVAESTVLDDLYDSLDVGSIRLNVA